MKRKQIRQSDIFELIATDNVAEIEGINKCTCRNIHTFLNVRFSNGRVKIILYMIKSIVNKQLKSLIDI